MGLEGCTCPDRTLKDYTCREATLLIRQRGKVTGSVIKIQIILAGETWFQTAKAWSLV